MMNMKIQTIFIYILIINRRKRRLTKKVLEAALKDLSGDTDISVYVLTDNGADKTVNFYFDTNNSSIVVDFRTENK